MQNLTNDQLEVLKRVPGERKPYAPTPEELQEVAVQAERDAIARSRDLF